MEEAQKKVHAYLLELKWQRMLNNVEKLDVKSTIRHKQTRHRGNSTTKPLNEAATKDKVGWSSTRKHGNKRHVELSAGSLSWGTQDSHDILTYKRPAPSIRKNVVAAV